VRLAVRLFAVLRERAGTARLVLDDLPGGLDVAGLKRELARRHPELGDLGAVRGVLGTRYVPDATPLDGAEELALLPPVSGGSGGAAGSGAGAGSGASDGPGDEAQALERGLFELWPRPLDVGACFRRVSHASCGAVCLFTGTTRATSRGQTVTHLEYEAFEAMAGPEMARIFARCREESGGAGRGGSEPLRMLCVHRVGTVGVGEPSVVIAVASPHRDAAFRAGRFLIDELKASLPVWKKEHYQGGAHWVGDRS
jgi:molybdopterin synthase catalytic subunit